MKTTLLPALACSLFASLAIAQVPPMPAAVPLPTPNVQFFDNNGRPVAGGLLYTYAAGTSTPLATYTDSTAGTPNANPVVLDSSGRANVWIQGQAYKVVLKTSLGAQLWSADNVTDTTFFYIQHLKYISDSSLLSYRNPATGTLMTTVLSKLNDAYLSARADCGAKGDGVTDDTAAIQKCLDALQSSGGAIYIPPGSYVVGAAGLRIHSNEEVFGAGDGTIFPVGAAMSYSNQGLFWGDTASNVYLHDLLIQGQNSSSSAENLNQKGTYFTTTTNTVYRNVKIQRLHVTGMAGEAIYSDGGPSMVAPFGVDYVDNVVEHCGGPDAYVHNFTGGGSGHVTGNYANDVIAGYEGPAENSDISNNRFLGVQYYGIWVHNFASTDKVRVRVMGNILRGVHSGAHASESVGILVGGWGMQVIGNDISGFGAPGIAVFSWLRGGGNPQSGVRNLVIGNSVHGNGDLATAAPPNFYPSAEIFVAGAASNTIVADNQIERETGTSYGLFNSGADTLYHGNHISGGFTNDTIEAGSNTVRYGNISVDDAPGAPFSTDNLMVYNDRNDGAGFTTAAIHATAFQGTNWLLKVINAGNVTISGIDQNGAWNGPLAPLQFYNSSASPVGASLSNGHFVWGGTTDTGSPFNVVLPLQTPGSLGNIFTVGVIGGQTLGLGVAGGYSYLQSFNGNLVFNTALGSKNILLGTTTDNNIDFVQINGLLNATGYRAGTSTGATASGVSCTITAVVGGIVTGVHCP